MVTLLFLTGVGWVGYGLLKMKKSFKQSRKEFLKLPVRDALGLLAKAAYKGPFFNGNSR